jgi:hypothetical protein
MDIPLPDMLEAPLACLLLLAVKCPEIKTNVCEEILRRLMSIHANDQFLCERCDYYLQRIAYVSARFSENREDEERKEKERERERVKRRNQLLAEAKKNGGGSDGVSNGVTRNRSERTSRPKKEKREKKSSSSKSGKDDKKGGDTMKKTKKGESRTMRSAKKKEEDKTEAERASATLRVPSSSSSKRRSSSQDELNRTETSSKEGAPRPLAERVEDVRSYLDFSVFLPAESTTPFDHTAPGTRTEHTCSTRTEEKDPSV